MIGAVIFGCILLWMLLSLLLGLFFGRLITIGRGPNGLPGSRCQSALGKAQS